MSGSFQLRNSFGSVSPAEGQSVLALNQSLGSKHKFMPTTVPVRTQSGPSLSFRAQRFVEVDVCETARKAHRMRNEIAHPVVRERIGNRVDGDPPRH